MTAANSRAARCPRSVAATAGVRVGMRGARMALHPGRRRAAPSPKRRRAAVPARRWRGAPA